MSNTTTDPRVEAGAKAWDKHMGGRYSPHEVDELSEEVAVILAAADAVDPREPRTITTVEELDALPRGSVVACISHILNLPVTFVFQRGSHNAMGYGWTTPDTPGQIESADVFEFVALNGYLTIFTVLVEPDFGAAA